MHRDDLLDALLPFVILLVVAVALFFLAPGVG